MSTFQTRQNAAALCQSLWFTLQSLNPSDDELDNLQGHIDAVLTWSNNQTKSATADTPVSVDLGGVKRRKDKKNKDKNKDGTNPTDNSAGQN